LTAAKVLGLLLIVMIGIVFASPSKGAITNQPANSEAWGMAMIFVLLSYGGWNEAVYISAELRDLKRT
jgi:amino acid transporter